MELTLSTKGNDLCHKGFKEHKYFLGIQFLLFKPKNLKSLWRIGRTLGCSLTTSSTSTTTTTTTTKKKPKTRALNLEISPNLLSRTFGVGSADKPVILPVIIGDLFLNDFFKCLINSIYYNRLFFYLRNFCNFWLIFIWNYFAVKIKTKNKFYIKYKKSFSSTKIFVH